MKHITSNELCDFRLGFLPQMEFTYVLRQLDIPYFKYITTYPSMMYMTVGPKRCLRMGWPASIKVNFTEPCHQVVRFVSRTVLIEPVDLQVVVIIVRNALEASLRRFDVLQVR